MRFKRFAENSTIAEMSSPRRACGGPLFSVDIATAGRRSQLVGRDLELVSVRVVEIDRYRDAVVFGVEEDAAVAECFLGGGKIRSIGAKREVAHRQHVRPG